MAVTISRNGKYGSQNVFLAAAPVTVAAAATGSGLTATVAAPGTIKLPDDWGTLRNTTLSGTVATTVSLNASTPGAFTGKITVTATGAGSTGDNVRLSQDLGVSATVTTCNTPPTITVNDVTLEGNALHGRTLAFSDIGNASDAEDAAGPTVTCAPAVGSVLPLGANTVKCTATDSKGLATSDSGVVTVVDTTKPVISGTPASMTLEASGASGSVATFGTPTALDTVWGALAVTCDAVSGSTFALGSTAVTCTAKDGSNNSQTSSFGVNVADTTAPVFAQPGDKTVEATSHEGAIVDFSSPDASDAVAGTIHGVCSPLSGSTFKVGDTTVACTASDGKNTGRTSFVVHVVDTTPPDLTVPGNMTIEATSAAGATVTYTASATDIVDGTVAVSCSPQSGSTFSLTTTTVTCTATDAAGNPATKSFTVTVKDSTPPTLVNLPADKTVQGNTAGGANTWFTPPTATDTVDPRPVVTCDNPESGFYPLGATKVACTATDASGNPAKGGFTITVVDTTAPTLVNLPANKTVQGNMAGGATDGFTAPTATDIVDAHPVVTCKGGPESGFYPLGATTVACTATDASGNHADGSFTITVVDTAAPTLVNLSADKTVEGNMAGGATDGFTAPTATDIVDAHPVVACEGGPESGFYPLGATKVACTATDASGNPAKGCFTITVVDTTAPT
ncbi:MAG: HYR domain-containing protein, partial [Actinobacteria bacterium]|nr:HYR domain-containing protein [Actinomycetota bacterium]